MATPLNTPSVHKVPAAAAGAGFVAGILTLVEAYFGSGHLPTGAEVAGLVSGAALSLGSIGAFLAHHAAWLKVVGPVGAELETAVPGLSQRLGAVEHLVQQQVSRVDPAIDVNALAKQVRDVIAHDFVAGGGAAAPSAQTPAA